MLVQFGAGGSGGLQAPLGRPLSPSIAQQALADPGATGVCETVCVYVCTRMHMEAPHANTRASACVCVFMSDVYGVCVHVCSGKRQRICRQGLRLMCLQGSSEDLGKHNGLCQQALTAAEACTDRY